FAAVQLGGGGDDESGAGEAAQVEDAAGGGAEEERSEGADTAAPLLEQGELIRSVAGPPTEVVRVLRREGIAAEVVDGAVVADARAGEVEAVLEGRPAGPVQVYIK
ncbi:MAG: hypothetical protein ACRDMU_08650, partial [Gaiellaceae bacterium]